MNVEAQLIGAFRNIAVSLASGIFVSAMVYLRKHDVIAQCRLLRRKRARYRHRSQ
jgi:hypothetical protein